MLEVMHDSMMGPNHKIMRDERLQNLLNDRQMNHAIELVQHSVSHFTLSCLVGGQRTLSKNELLLTLFDDILTHLG